MTRTAGQVHLIDRAGHIHDADCPTNVLDGVDHTCHGKIYAKVRRVTCLVLEKNKSNCSQNYLSKIKSIL